MKSVVQIYKTGELNVVESPKPQLRKDSLLIKTAFSVISAGTEKTKVDMGHKSLLGKAKSRPDLVKQVIAKAKREGLWKTWQTVQDRLSAPSSLGYCSAGEVLEVSGDANGLAPGDLVACAGSSANHAEIITVPKNLVVPVPKDLRLDHAAFATLGAIALQGVRQAEVRVGEKIAVIGLGLIGLLTVQILRAAGCRVFGIDIATDRLQLASKLGCRETALASDESLEEQILAFTDGYGVDATIVTAASSSNQPIEQAAEITREKGKVVVVGLTRMDLPREPFYLKELDLRLSRSYGPGRYDRRFEDEGIDYPYAYVRFTEQRNMASFLELVESGAVLMEPLITHRFEIQDAAKAYSLLHGVAREPYLGILLEYPRKIEDIPTRIELRPAPLSSEKLRMGVIGAGNYATANLLPFLQKHPAIALNSVCTGSGMTALNVAQRLEFNAAESDPAAVIRDSDAVLVATRHNEHANYVRKSLEQGKSVFVEKPLALTEEELSEIIQTARDHPGASVTVGFNRRFAPATQAVVEHFQNSKAPRQILIRVNAGNIPREHWVHDSKVGGGRLIGEGCHFVDLAVFLSASLVRRVSACAIPKPGIAPEILDNFSINLEMENGSIATIVYTSVGDSGLAKERIEISSGGKSAVISDFCEAELWFQGRAKRVKSGSQDKGQAAEIDAWVKALKTGSQSIPFSEIVNVHQACFAAVRSIRDGSPVVLSQEIDEAG